MNIYSSSDKGITRSVNEDAFFAGSFDDGNAFAVVCDGMGGVQGGSVASRLAVDHLSASLKSGYRPNMNESSIRNLLEASVSAANIRVFDKSKESKELNGMGTTVVAVVTAENTAYISHAGDSRAYVFTDGNLTQITCDHSIVQTMIEKGKLTPEEARFHPRKNVITRALGVDESMIPEFSVCDFPKGSKLLICTDGLTNFVEIAKISEILQSSGDITKELIDEANKNGGGDNVTAVVLENN